MAHQIVPGRTPARAIGHVAAVTCNAAAALRGRCPGRQSRKAAMLRQLAAGKDRGELGHPVCVETRWEGTAGHALPDNRPGSWEACGLEFMMGNALNQLAAAPRDPMANSSRKPVSAGD